MHDGKTPFPKLRVKNQGCNIQTAGTVARKEEKADGVCYLGRNQDSPA